MASLWQGLSPGLGVCWANTLQMSCSPGCHCNLSSFTGLFWSTTVNTFCCLAFAFYLSANPQTCIPGLLTHQSFRPLFYKTNNMFRNLFFFFFWSQTRSLYDVSVPVSNPLNHLNSNPLWSLLLLSANQPPERSDFPTHFNLVCVPLFLVHF